MRSDVSFVVGEGIKLSGWLYRPTGVTGKVPVIVMSHGTGCVKEMGLEPFAEAFTKAGYACLAYDHRNLGASEGEPRGELDPFQQVSDMKDAITYASSLEGIDSQRIGLWGTSYAGGHVIVVAATDRRVKCVVAQVPTLSGSQTSVLGMTEQQIDEMLQAFAEDRAARARGEEPRRTGMAPAGTDTGDWLRAASAGTSYRPDLTLRSKELRMAYEPIWYIDRISPTPFLMVGVTNDSRSPTEEQEDGFSRALEPRKLVMIEGGHYSVYGETQPQASAAAIDWFNQHISPSQAEPALSLPTILSSKTEA